MSYFIFTFEYHQNHRIFPPASALFTRFIMFVIRKLASKALEYEWYLFNKMSDFSSEADSSWELAQRHK